MHLQVIWTDKVSPTYSKQCFLDYYSFTLAGMYICSPPINKCINAYFFGFSLVLYVLKAASCCCTPYSELANCLSFRITIVCSIQSRRSDVKVSYSCTDLSESKALSITYKIVIHINHHT